jgi:hypothetical protein
VALPTTHEAGPGLFSGAIMTYQEKLKDPRWQRKRLEILNRDDFTCKGCGSKDRTLHVHHFRYVKGCDPWDYGAADLVTLCDRCHLAVIPGPEEVANSIMSLRVYAVKSLTSVITSLDPEVLDLLMDVTWGRGDFQHCAKIMTEIIVKTANEARGKE